MKIIFLLTIFLSLILIGSAFAKLPSKVYLPVPFTTQAPYGDWSQPYQDACEEAAVVMALRYIQGKGLTSKAANQEILELVNFQIQKYGDFHSTNAQETAQLIKDFYSYAKVEIKADVGIEDIKLELSKGNPVLAPMAGRLLKNPYYTPPGPVYHMLLIKGYDEAKQEFIVNDDGTRRGKNYRYRYATILNALHDWTGNPAAIEQGRRAMIIISN